MNSHIMFERRLKIFIQFPTLCSFPPQELGEDGGTDTGTDSNILLLCLLFIMKIRYPATKPLSSDRNLLF